jgi:hypothetical protein
MQVTSDINAEVESQNRHLDNLVRACLPFPHMRCSCTAVLVEGKAIQIAILRMAVPGGAVAAFGDQQLQLPFHMTYYTAPMCICSPGEEGRRSNV